MRAGVIVLVLLLAWSARAHDLITAELAEGYLKKAAKWQQQSVAAADKGERAMAQLRIGVMLDEIRAYLNRDLAVHGEVQGLASNYLVAELESLGTPLAYSRTRNYYIANSGYYRTALELGLSSAVAREARLRLLRGEFYDSFDVDPLQTRQSAEQLRTNLALVDELVSSISREPDLEEVRFMAAIVYAWAAKSASDARQQAEYRSTALAHIDLFESSYPDSLRSAAMPVVRDALLALR